MAVAHPLPIVTRHLMVALGYALLAGAAIAATRFDGGVACLWGATGVLAAHLALLPRRQWRIPVLVCAAINVVLTITVGLGPLAAVPVTVLNMIEAIIVVGLLRRFHAQRDMVTSLQRLAALTFAVSVAAIVTGLGSAAVLHLLFGAPVGVVWANWASGHLLGTIAVTPIASMVLSGELSPTRLAPTRGQMVEAGALFALTAVTTVSVFAQSALPMLFVPVLPLILATLRLGRVGAAISVITVAAIGAWCTLAGLGPMALVDASDGSQARFFQFYIAVTMMTALPLAAELTQRRRVFDELRDSEARYRLLADHSSDIVMNVDRNGCIRYISPSVAQLGGWRPEALVGTPATELVAPGDRLLVVTAYRSALRAPGETVIVEYRGRVADGSERWFETHVRAIADDGGMVTGTVSISRDVAHRKSIEAELTRVAATDALTGLANRRGFEHELERRIAQAAESPAAGGCVAVFDLDHFKQVNDRHGHEVGDRVLEAFAQVARRTVRDGDLVARLGGEEFGVVLAGANLEKAQLVCERLRAGIAQTSVAVGTESVGVTVSAGIAAFDGTLARREVMRAADAALYRAKRAGRNRLDLAA